MPDPDRARQEARARLILQAMGTMKYDGMVIGERDLALGLPFLIEAAKQANVPLLSANLWDPSGKSLFPGHLVFQDGSLKICAVALSPSGNYGSALTRQDPAGAAQRELVAVAGEGCAVKLLLANLPRPELEDTLKKVPGFDLVASAHDGWQAEPQLVAGVPTVYCGQRGRSVTRLDIVRNEGNGPFVDLGGIGRNLEDLKRYDKQIGDLQTQIAKAKPELQANFKTRLQTLEKLKEEKAKTVSTTGEPSRSFRSKFFTLDTSVADDPDLKKLADAYAAKYPDAVAAARPPPPRLPIGGKPPFPGRPPVMQTLQPRPPPPVIARPASPPPPAN